MSDAAAFSGGVVQDVQVHPDSLVILASLTGEENLALGRSVVDQFGKRVPLADGSIALVRSEWISGTPNVFGQEFTVDLGVARAINRVRLLAGETALAQGEYFVRGYRLETSPRTQVWQLLSEESENFRLNVDTRQDSTWVEFDESGAPVPRVGRFVRLTVIRQDRSNWVAIGDIEVYGQGYTNEGFIEDGFSPETPVNVGRVRWGFESAEQTEVELQVRGTSDDGVGLEWSDVAHHTESGFLFEGEEPVERIEYRALLQNEAPHVTPVLQRIEVEYDPTLVASDLAGAVLSEDPIRKGVPARLGYQIQTDVGADDYGVDLVRLQGAAFDVEQVRIDGRSLELDPTLSRGFRFSELTESAETLIELAPEERIGTSAVIEIIGQALFLQDLTAVTIEAGSRQQDEADGYINWQRGRELSPGAWTVLASGKPLNLLSTVEVSPQPFSPFSGESLGLQVVVSNIEAGREISLKIFTLDGGQVRRLRQSGRARLYRFDWDGRDGQGKVVAPGLYLYEVGVSESSAARRGTLVVAY
ncbi:MAG TPA: hypothetical protein QGF95_04155 [Candidatus Latescibacteria bacterium]|nr:hypothetical protein [Candidatus Latescibacterota bacterium]